VSLVGLLVAAAMGVPQTAEATPSARLVYVRSADALSCGDETMLRKEVVRRFGYDPFFAWAPRTVVVEVSKADRRFRARLQVVDELGLSRGARELLSAVGSCADLLDAAALAISIALDASLATAPSGSASVGSSPAPAPEAALEPAPVPASAPGSSSGGAPGPGPPSSAAPASPSGAAEPAASPSGRAPPVTVSVGADVLAAIGTAPSPSAGLAFFGSVRARALSIGLEVRADAPASAAFGSDAISAWPLLAGVVPCAHVAWSFFCAVGEVGVLEGRAASGSQEKSAFLAMAGARVGGEITLSTAFALRAHADGLVDLDRPILKLGDQFWHVPVLAGTVGVGVVAHIR
jgi:hypothetical protein